MVRGKRTHRLPQHFDYILIPAPLDLTLPLVDEKSPLPAIIVTPSSPRSVGDFSIAFLAPVPKPTIRQRLSTIFAKSLTSLRSSPITLTTKLETSSLSLSAPFKARTMIMLLLLVVVVGCHLITHSMAIHRPHMDFDNPGLGLGDHSSAKFGSEQVSSDQEPGPRYLGGRLEVWEVDDGDEPHSFAVTEPLEDPWVSVEMIGARPG